MALSRSVSARLSHKTRQVFPSVEDRLVLDLRHMCGGTLVFVIKLLVRRQGSILNVSGICNR